MLLLTKLQSLPVTKKIGAKHILAVSLSKVKWPGVFIATGSHTFFGKTAKLVASAGGESHAQKAMFKIGNFLIVVAIILALIMVGFRVYNDLTAHSFGLDTALSILTIEINPKKQKQSK